MSEQIKKNSGFAALLIFAAGVAIGMAGWVPKLDAWVHYAIEASMAKAWWRYLLPVYLTEVQSTVFRPVQNLLLIGLYRAFDLSPTPYYVAKALLHGVFGLAAFRYFSVASKGGRNAAAIALLAMLSAPVVYSGWNISEFGHVSSGFIFLALWAFLAPSGSVKKSVAVFVGFALLTVATKETEAVILPALLAIHIVQGALEGRGVKKRDLVCLGAAAAIVLACYATIANPDYAAPKHKLTSGYASFLLHHNLSQLFYLLFCGGTTALFAGGLALAAKKRGLPAMLAPAVAAAMILVAFTMPPTPIFSFYEAVFFPKSPQLLFFQGLLLGGVALWAIFADGRQRFAALAALAIFAMMYLLPLLVPFVRADIGARHYITALPFLLYLAFEGARALGEAGGEGAPSSRFGRIAGAVCLGLMAVNIVVGAADLKLRYFARSRVEREGDKWLANADLSDATILFTDPIWRLTSSEVKLVRGGKDAPDIVFVNPVNPDRSAKAVLQELTLKGGGAANVFLYDVRRSVEAPEKACPALEGNFDWTESPDSFFGLTDINEGLFQDLAEKIDRSGSYNFVKVAQKRMCSEKNFFDEAAGGRLRRIAEKRAAFLQLPRMVEEIPARLIEGVPVAVRNAYDFRLSEVDIASLRKAFPGLVGQKLLKPEDLIKRYRVQIGCNEVAQEARRLNEKGDLKGATDLLVESAKRCGGGDVYDEMFCSALIDRSRKLLEEGDRDAAAETLKQLSQCMNVKGYDDTLCGALMEQSKAMLADGKTDEALALLAGRPECKGIDEESVCGATVARAQAMMEKGDIQGAMEAMAENPDCEMVGTFRQSWCELRQEYLWKAIADSNLEDAAATLQDIEAACEGAKSYEQILSRGTKRLASAAVVAGRPDLAMAAYANLVRLGGATILDYFEVGDLYLAEEGPTPAPEDVARFIQTAREQFSDDGDMMELVKKIAARYPQSK